MHLGSDYHAFMLASPRDRKVRERFQRLVCRLVQAGGTILDFGAGTGIDAKLYAERKFKVLAYEPGAENRAYLAKHCSGDLEKGTVVLTDLSENSAAQVIAANFAVLNLIADLRALFATFSRLLEPEGHVVASLLNPYFVGDARYPWWWAKLDGLLRSGSYAVEGVDGPVYRFSPTAVTRAATPDFSRVALYPAHLGLAISPYMFIVLRKVS
jgi:SAM-dependent methyltransferase